MDLKKILKKLAFPESFLSSRRKVVLDFGLGLGVSLLILTVIVFNNPFKASPLSWPFSFSNAVLSSPSRSSFASTDMQNFTDLMERNEEGRVQEKTHFSSSDLQNFTDLMERGEEGRVQESTHEVNALDKSENASFTSSSSDIQDSMDLLEENEEGRVQEKTHEGNSLDKSENASFTSDLQMDRNEEGRVQEKTHEGIITGKSENASFTSDLQNYTDLMVRNEEGRVQEKTHEENIIVKSENASLIDSNSGKTVTESILDGKFSEKGKNGSFSSREGTIDEKILPGNSSQLVNNASFNTSKEDEVSAKTHEEKSSERDKAESVVSKSKGIKENATGKGETVSSLGREERVSEKTHDPNSSQKGKIESSYNDSVVLKKLGDSSGKCDIFDGRWVRDEGKPLYPAGSCPHIGRGFDCHLNRRPDGEFLKWKWQPNGCNIPSLNSTDFLERLRGKRLVFVGDSLNRNMWESLVCILRNGVKNKKRVYEISGRKEFKKKGFYAFRYEDYNCSIDFVSSPFLVSESSFKGKKGSIETLRLDLMDRSTLMYREADIVVFNTGHWWTHEKTSRGEDYYQEGNYVHPKLKVLEAYEKALTTWAKWVDKNINAKRTQVFFRGYSVTHFRGGQWNSGGQCHKEAEPIFNETYLGKYPPKMRALEHVLQQMKTPVAYMNISRLTDYRKDGHPSIYRKEYKSVEEQVAAERTQDCSHWCLPGVPDTWNELLYASLLLAGRGSWRN